MTRQSHAIQMTRYGDPSVLRFVAFDPPPLTTGEVRVRTIAAAVNHTDLEIRAGNWPIRKPDPFPYVPGVEVVGEVVELGAGVRHLEPGTLVITMMQGLGGVKAKRPGGYSELVTVDADQLAMLPAQIDPVAMAAIGLGGVTAHEALRLIGPLRGRRIVVTGAAGGVGMSGVAIARAKGATVAGVVSRAEQVAHAKAAGASEVYLAGEVHGIEPGSADGVLDTVGAALFGTSMSALKPGGVYALVGAVGGRLRSWPASYVPAQSVPPHGRHSRFRQRPKLMPCWRRTAFQVACCSCLSWWCRLQLDAASKCPTLTMTMAAKSRTCA